MQHLPKPPWEPLYQRSLPTVCTHCRNKDAGSCSPHNSPPRSFRPCLDAPPPPLPRMTTNPNQPRSQDPHRTPKTPKTHPSLHQPPPPTRDPTRHPFRRRPRVVLPQPRHPMPPTSPVRRRPVPVPSQGPECNRTTRSSHSSPPSYSPTRNRARPPRMGFEHPCPPTTLTPRRDRTTTHHRSNPP